jgi:hypothetical protein
MEAKQTATPKTAKPTDKKHEQENEPDPSPQRQREWADNEPGEGGQPPQRGDLREPQPELKDLREAGGEPKTGSAAVKAAAQGEKLRPQESASALDFFLQAREQDSGTRTKALQLRVGEGWFDWVIRPVDMDTMRSIRRRAMDTKQARRTGDVDENRVNLAMVVAGTVEPNLQAEAKEAHAKGVGPPDPAEILRMMLADKPGYIAQIAGEIMSLSGFDDEDVREAEQVEAGKASS